MKCTRLRVRVRSAFASSSQYAGFTSHLPGWCQGRSGFTGSVIAGLPRVSLPAAHQIHELVHVRELFQPIDELDDAVSLARVDDPPCTRVKLLHALLPGERIADPARKPVDAAGMSCTAFHRDGHDDVHAVEIAGYRIVHRQRHAR